MAQVIRLPALCMPMPLPDERHDIRLYLSATNLLTPHTPRFLPLDATIPMPRAGIATRRHKHFLPVLQRCTHLHLISSHPDSLYRKGYRVVLHVPGLAYSVH